MSSFGEIEQKKKALTDRVGVYDAIMQYLRLVLPTECLHEPEDACFSVADLMPDGELSEEVAVDVLREIEEHARIAQDEVDALNALKMKGVSRGRARKRP